MATEKGRKDIVKLFIHHGVDVNYQQKVQHNKTMHC